MKKRTLLILCLLLLSLPSLTLVGFAQTPPLVFIPGPRPVSPPLVFRPSYGSSGPGAQGIQGIQGIPGTQGIPGSQGVPGPAGTSAAGIAGIISSLPGLGLTVAKGDGTTDDTAALQSQIDYASAHNLDCLLAPGTYKVGPLHLARPGIATSTGVVLRALTGGISSQGIAGQGVTLIPRDANQEALLIIDGASTYGMQIRGIALQGNATTKAGLKSRATNWSALTLYDVAIRDCGIAIYISNPDGGNNGESLRAYNIQLGGYSNNTCCYKNDSLSGQAISHYFYGLSAGTQNGGTVFDVGTGGANDACLMVFGLTGTSSNGPLANTLVHSRGAARVSIQGDRMEHVNRVAILDTSFGKVIVEGITFPQNDGDTGGLSFLDVGSTNNFDSLVCRDCTFAGNNHPLVLGTAVGNSGTVALFDSCDFVNYTDINTLLTPPSGSLRTKFRNSRVANTGAGNFYTDITDR